VAECPALGQNSNCRHPAPTLEALSKSTLTTLRCLVKQPAWELRGGRDEFRPGSSRRLQPGGRPGRLGHRGRARFDTGPRDRA